MKLRTSEDRWKYFYKRTKVLRGIGCWPLFGKKKTKFEVIYTYLSVAVISEILMSLVFIFTATLNLIRDRGEFDAEVCEQVILFIISFQILSKMGVMAYKARHLQKLIDDLSGTMQRRFVIKTRDIEAMNHCRKYDHKLSKFFLTLSLLLFVSSMTRPLANTLKKLHKARAFNSGTIVIGELPSKYPFDLHADSYWYAFWYLQQVISVLFGALSSWASDSMFCSFLFYLCGHLDILSDNIKNQGRYGDEENDLDDPNVGGKVMAKRVVDQHCYLIRFGKELNKAFAPIIVVQLLLGSITIGLQLIQFFLIKSEGIFIYAKPMVYLSLKLVQLYISSWHGQLLWDRSLHVCEASYSSLWYNQPKSWVMSINMIMIRSRRPLKVEISSIFQFSAEKFGNILNTAYSFFTMLRTVNSN